MRTVKWNAFLSCLCVLAAALGGLAASVRADVTIDKGASVLIFPKVRADGTFETTIQIANTGNSLVVAKCFYVNASGSQCQETDFTILLTKQQPTVWVVGSGRPYGYYGGIQPGAIPPMGNSFIGELKCIETDLTGAPVTGNHLKGETTIEAVRTGVDSKTGLQVTIGDVTKHNALGILGNPAATASNPVTLDGGATYAACPGKQILNFLPTGSSDPLSPATTRNYNELTLVTCQEDFENQLWPTVVVQFLVFNSYEQRFSASTSVKCFLNTELTAIDVPSRQNYFNTSVFGVGVLQTNEAQVEITPVPYSNGTSTAVAGVGERILVQAGTATRAGINLHTDGDLVAVPPDQIRMPTGF
ncbi:MAG: hypothetical protein H6Q33_3540 [Deltaproteobacteria bacterium]|jgi:hypothetical protein|nr:hypothetical protein [Deltaproteobacteria bacterium]